MSDALDRIAPEYLVKGKELYRHRYVKTPRTLQVLMLNALMNSAEGADDMPVSLDLHDGRDIELTLHRLILNQHSLVLASRFQFRMANW